MTQQEGVQMTVESRGLARSAVILVATVMAWTGLAQTAGAASFGTERTVATGVGDPGGLAADSAGDLFVANGGENILEVASDGAQSSVGPDLGSPGSYAVAVDSMGDLFVGDLSDNELIEIFPDGTSSVVADDIRVSAVAVDSTGDLFVFDVLTRSVIEIESNGTQKVIATGFELVDGIAVDPSGDVYAADSEGNRVVMIAPDGAETAVGSELTAPTGLGLNAAGDVFISEATPNGQVLQVAPDGTQTTIGSGFRFPEGLAVDSAGNVFVGDETGDDRIVEIPVLGDSTSTSLQCGPAAPAGAAQTCSITVADTQAATNTPTGTVSLTASGAGAFSAESCALVNGSCSVTYTPEVAGTGAQTITAAYSGDNSDQVSSASTALSILASRTTTTVSCAKPSARQKAKVQKGKAILLSCAATVHRPIDLKPQSLRPTGTMSFSVTPTGDNAEGFPTGATCTLALHGRTERCSVQFETASPDLYRITASYSSDQSFLSSSGIASVNTA